MYLYEVPLNDYPIKSKYDTNMDWLKDQTSLIDFFGKISADPAVLEPQRQQVDGLIKESLWSIIQIIRKSSNYNEKIQWILSYENASKL